MLPSRPLLVLLAFASAPAGASPRDAAADSPVARVSLLDGYLTSDLQAMLRGSALQLGPGTSPRVRSALEVPTHSGLDRGLYGMVDEGGASTLSPLLERAVSDVALALGVPLGRPADVFLRFLDVGAEVPSPFLYGWASFGFALIGVRVDLVRPSSR